jgi:hypothetical protein
VKGEGGGSAFARCLSLEHPSIRVLALDLPFGSPEAMTWIDAEAASAAPGYREARTTVRGFATRRSVTTARPTRWSGKRKDLRHMRLAIWKNNQPPNAMPVGQSTKEPTLLDIGTTPVL